MKKRSAFAACFTLGGAFTATVIGSGFATGQEILQFYTAFGFQSYAIILTELVCFILVGNALMTSGFEHRNDPSFQPYTYFCGKYLGTFYMYLTPVILTFFLSVMLSGAGATMYEYFGVDRFIGSAVIACCMLVSYLIGFRRLVKVISVFGPCVIFFLLLVGVVTVLRDGESISRAPQYFDVLARSQAAASWPVSAMLYLSINFMSSTPYFTQLGSTAKQKSHAVWGTVIGCVMLISAIAITNTAILLHAGEAAALDIPMLFLARTILDALGAIFSVILLLGIFSTCATMMWTVCSQFAGRNKKKDKIFAVFLTVGTYALGLMPFSSMIASIYPIIGYIGLGFVFCVLFWYAKRLFFKKGQ